MEDPRIRTLLELRRDLEEELERLRERTERIEAYLEALDSTIGKGSFATADAALARPSPAASPPASEAPIPRKEEILNKSRDLQLATVEVSETDLTVVPAPHASYDIKRGAFARFFVEQILGKFQQEDRHRVENGEIEWADAFDFEVKSDEGVLTLVTIKNYGGEARLQEILRALRWALEKVYRER
ncbi:MAG: hypothetical protein HXY34_11125 [Candidatus Thorarchaeota archaeon]|nr:hypothetical protein [Candidatus Thorarchaeota archaeon]